MTRKRWRSRLSIYEIPKIDPKDRNAVEAVDLVRHALVDFDELALLSGQAREQLVGALVVAISFARGGVKAGKRGLSDKALTQQVFLSDVSRALEQAGLRATRWRKRYDSGDGPDLEAPESFLFKLARELAEVAGIPLPQDLKLPSARASRHQYGMMSPAMDAAQEAELAEWRERLAKLARRLRAAAP